MGHRIIKKKNGLFALWTTVCDDFLMDDATQEEIIEQLLKWEEKDLKEKLIIRFNHNTHIFTDYEKYCKLRELTHQEIPKNKDLFND